MKCRGCPFYASGFQWNGCKLTESECFYEVEDCTLVNDDGTVNTEELEKYPG